MDYGFDIVGIKGSLSANAYQQLRDCGFAVLPGAVVPAGVALLLEAYDAAVASATPDDIHIGSSTTRINDFVNRGPAFDALYLFPPLLDACCRIIGRPFRLSTMHARTLRTCSPAQNLHVDFGRDGEGFPMVGFILMVDEFRPDNGATRFVQGSHKWTAVTDDQSNHRDSESQVLACGSAGSIIIYNGSVWHGHTANSSSKPRRSIQGAYIRRDAQSGVNLAARMSSDTLARISPVAKYLLAI